MRATIRQLRKTAKKSGRRRVGGLVLVVVGVYLIVVMARDLWDLWQSRDRVKEAREKVERLREEEVRLEGQLKIVESEGFVEQQIRDELMLAKEGETIVVLPAFDSAQGKQVDQDNQEKQEDSENWQKWLRLFW